MRKVFLLAALACLAISVCASAQNLCCPNPGMENSNPQWYGGQYPDRWEKALPYMVRNLVYAWEPDGVGESGRCI